MGDLSEKRAVVTGAASGIGRAVARALADEGARVVVADLEEEGGKRTVESIRESGGEAVFQKTDVSSEEDVTAMIDAARENFGGLDVLVNNAGIEGSDQQPITDLDVEVFDQVVAVNLRGVWLGMKYGIQEMLRDGGGSVVNIASIAGKVGFEEQSPYCGSKSGVIGMTRSVALEFATQDVRVNAIAPGIVQTSMVERYEERNPGAQEMFDQVEAMEGRSSPENIADTAVFLASDRAARITGSTIPVEGGYLAG